MVKAKRRLAAILAADVAGYSRLMGDDERATMDTLTAYRKVFRKHISDHDGRVVDTAGDSVLAVFDSVVEAVQCAVDVQGDIEPLNADLPESRRMLFRIGVNLGDVIVQDDGTIYGDCVNVAARLESLAEPGGVCASETARLHAEGKLDITFEDVGEHVVKNIAQPVHVYRVQLGREDTAHPADSPKARQEIRFCTAADGVRIAYAVSGEGPLLVKTGNWMTHLEYDWSSPIWGHVMGDLSKDYRLIRYDARGNGLSDRDVDDFSFEAMVRDLETVVETLGVKHFALLGISQGCAVSVAYAVRHPERLTHLVLYGGYARGRRQRGSQDETERADALNTLIRLGWGQDNPAFRQVFTSLFVPDGTPEQVGWFNELQRITISPENAARFRSAMGDIEVSDVLAKVSTPTLVIHCRDDAVVPLEEGRRMAAMISGARFVVLEGRNHLILENEPAWSRFLEEIQTFLSAGDLADG